MRRFYLIVAAFLLILSGCTRSAAIEVDVLEPTSNEESYEEAHEGPEEETQNLADANAAETAYYENLTFDYYSEDKSVYIRQNYNTRESAIVDGDQTIPVDIAMGVYGPYIEKSDVDGDGENEYLIADCEGTGTGVSMYGLCIVNKNDEGYVLTKYESEYFTKAIEDRITYSYDPGTHQVSFATTGEKHAMYSVTLERESELEGIDWFYIIRIQLAGGKPYLSAPSGYMYSDWPAPLYEQAVNVTAPIIVNEDSTITIGEFAIEEEKWD